MVESNIESTLQEPLADQEPSGLAFSVQQQILIHSLR